jgi:hypothetical protein
MRQTFSLGDPARVARRHNLRHRTAQHRMPFPATPPGFPMPKAAPAQATETDWMAPLDEEGSKALRAAWSFVE